MIKCPRGIFPDAMTPVPPQDVTVVSISYFALPSNEKSRFKHNAPCLQFSYKDRADLYSIKKYGSYPAFDEK